jgi:hypothetical protein
MNERHRQILDRLSKDKPAPVDLETVRQGYCWGIDQLKADLTELERDHCIDIVGLKHVDIEGNDRLIGEAKIASSGEKLLANDGR